MKSSKFVKPNDPILSLISQPIEDDRITSSETNNIIEVMLKVAYGEQIDKRKPLLVGLAAPQIGISKRIILVDVSSLGKGNVGNSQVFINPKILWQSQDESEWYEGCFSTDKVCGVVSRPNKIKVRAYSQDGTKVEAKYSGYTARIFQHEIDHLNGREFVSHITDDSKLHWVKEDEFPKYRNLQAWRNWPNKCPRSRWEQIKGNAKNG